MGQFTVHRNVDPATAERFPLFIDIQDNLLSSLATRVVIPLTPHEQRSYDVLWTLVPELSINGARYMLLTPQVTHMTVDQLGPVVAELGSDRHVVLAAAEMIFRGL
jgi:toxin CcdB